VELGDDAAMATAPHVPAAAMPTAAGTTRRNRLDFRNRSPFSGVLDTEIVARRPEEVLRAG
jgi:hypothetical protein